MSAAFVGQTVGAALAMALFGALIAWVLRRITKLALVPSYALGVLAMSFIAPALYVAGTDGAVTDFQAWKQYAVGGLIGFLILAVTAREKDPSPPIA